MLKGEVLICQPGWGGCTPTERQNANFGLLIKEATGKELFSFWGPKNRPGDLPPLKVFVRDEEGKIEAVLHDAMEGEQRDGAREIVWNAWRQARDLANIAFVDTVSVTPDTEDTLQLAG